MSCVRFASASTEYFTGPNWNGLGLTQAEVWVIIKVNNDPPGALADCGIWALNDGTDIFRLCLFPFTDGAVYDTPFTQGTRTSNNFATTLAQWNAYYVSNSAGGPNTFNNFLNGTAGSTPQNNGVVSPATVYLGRSSVTGFDAYLNGDVAEFFVFSVSTSGAQLSSIKSYMLSFYGITVS